ncbi:MAG: DUF2764 family protein [Candidatus Aceula meridiana]|nr:DUF2764 family protein [Candidatus Aceula meridiana]
MSDFYYLAASLPSLDFEKALPFSYREFLDNCQRLISEKDFCILNQAVLDFDNTHAEHPTLWAIAKFNRLFKNEMVRVRAKRIDKDSSDYVRGDRYADQISVDVVNRAAKAENPFESEKILDRYRWEKFDEISVNHLFDLIFLITYSLKIQLLERHQEINSEKGAAQFEAYRKAEAFEELFSKI